MEYANQFFQGLDGPASLTFLGIVTAFFLLGLLPAGLTYAFRVRDIKKRLAKHIAAHQNTLQERNMLEGQLGREQERSEGYLQRLRNSSTDRASQETSLADMRKDLDLARGAQLTAEVSMREAEDTISALQNKVASLHGQVSDLRSKARPRAQPQFFDSELRATLKHQRAKIETLEARISELMEDNEVLRRKRESNSHGGKA